MAQGDQAGMRGEGSRPPPPPWLQPSPVTAGTGREGSRPAGSPAPSREEPHKRMATVADEASDVHARRWRPWPRRWQWRQLGAAAAAAPRRRASPVPPSRPPWPSQVATTAAVGERRRGASCWGRGSEGREGDAQAALLGGVVCGDRRVHTAAHCLLGRRSETALLANSQRPCLHTTVMPRWGKPGTSSLRSV